MKSLLFAAGMALGAFARAATVGVQTPDGDVYRLTVTSLKEVRYKAIMRQQYDFSCGSAALATLLTYHYGYPINEQTVFQEMYRRGNQTKIRNEGFSLLDMKTFLEAHGFHADGFQLPLEKLEGAHLPAIVLLADNGYRHFVVIKGIRNGRILIGDPSSGTRSMSRKAFEAKWVSKLLFVIHSGQNIARFNQPRDWGAAPPAPLATAVDRQALDRLTIPKLGPGDY